MLLATTVQNQNSWAQERVQQTGYQQAVMADLALNRSDTLIFAAHAMLKLIEEQRSEIAQLNTRVADLSLAIIKKGSK